ncbi:hypothetical protein F2Q69_00053841, partial [Brassica cretica]
RVSDNNFNGTIPAFIGNWSRLQKLYLYASGLKGPIPDEIARLENLTNLILRNVSLSGQIPSYIWKMRNLKLLDLSFNNLTGDVHGGRAPEYTYLTGNRLSGEVESGVFLKSNAHININTYQSSHLNNLNELLPCAGPTNYTSYHTSTPLSLVYYAFCLENGTYSVKLHFMEIQFSDQELYSSLGRLIFDVYVQVKRHCLSQNNFVLVMHRRLMFISLSTFSPLLGSIVLE